MSSMVPLDDLELSAFRRQMGLSFAAVSRDEVAFSEVGEGCWAVFSGLPLRNGQRFLISRDSKVDLERYEHKFAALGVSGIGIFAGEGKLLSLNENWSERASSALMSFNLQEYSEEELTKHLDPRVYLAKNSDYERVAQCLVEAFSMEASTIHLSTFAIAAKNIDQHHDTKLFLIDDGGKVASLVWSVIIEGNSVLLAMGTIPESRRKGLAKAILFSSFVDAKKQGLKKSILFASDMGQLLYEAVGFKVHEYWDIAMFSLPRPE